MLIFLCGPELLSDDSLAISSPRLSPDQCRIVYLQYPSLIPHHQCSQLCLVSWRWVGAVGGIISKKRGLWVRADELMLMLVDEFQHHPPVGPQWMPSCPGCYSGVNTACLLRAGPGG
jgi:hypothetical protein